MNALHSTHAELLERSLRKVFSVKVFESQSRRTQNTMLYYINEEASLDGQRAVDNVNIVVFDRKRRDIETPLPVVKLDYHGGSAIFPCDMN